MRRDSRRPEHRAGASKARARVRTRLSSSFAVEPLEDRRLLSIYQGPTKSRPLFSGSAFYQITLTGPGYETVYQIGQGHHRIIGINLTGTTMESQLSVTLQSTRRGFGTANSVLQIGAIKVQSGQLGGIHALGTANLLGAITPLQGTVQTIGFNSLGKNAQITVLGNLGTFQAGSVNLSANGMVHVTGSVTGQFSVSSVNLDGGKVLVDQNAVGGLSLGGLSIEQEGQFLVGHDVNGASTLGPVVINSGRFSVGHDILSSGSLSAMNVTLENQGQFIVTNDLGSGLQVGGNVTIESNGLFRVGGNLNGLNAGDLLIDSSGQLLVGHDTIAPLVFSSVTVQNGGQLSVGHNLTGGIQVGGSERILSKGLFNVGNDLGSMSVGSDLTLDTSGKLSVGHDISGTFAVLTGLNVSNNAQLSVGNDIVGAATVTGNVTLSTGGSILVGANVNGLTINGNLVFTPATGTFSVLGNLSGLTIEGSYMGPGNTTTSNPELNVGLNLSNLSVLGGTASQGAISNANIAVGKNLLGINVPHGIFNSLITVGVLLDGTGGTSSSSGTGGIGADGSDSVFDSQILAGVAIKDLTINGNVHSDYVTNPNPTGFRTRIIAGENRQGVFTSGGLIDNFQITGQLIDAVLAASVQPYGGDGTLPPTGYGANPMPNGQMGDDGFDTYDAPAGVIVGGTFGTPISYPNYSEVSYKNEILTGVAYNMAIDPTIDDFIFPGGAINPSFASAPAAASVTTTISSSNQSQIGSSSSTGGQSTSTGLSSTTGSTSTATFTNTTTNIALPTKSTVLGGVVSTPHGNNPDAYDFAGIFAFDARGVFVGPIPPPAPPGSS